MTSGAAGKALDVAVFGAGRIGRIHAANLARQPGVRLKYVIDVNREAAQALAAQHGAQVAGIDEAFGDASIGATVICSSTDTHSELIMRSAAAGKHIFCEKPVDLAIGRARECADAVARAGVVAMIGFQRRYDPTFAALKQRLDAGEIGTPEMLVVTSRDPGAPPVEYIKHSGGIFKDMLIHDFDIFRWILDDEADTVHATGSCLSDPAIAEAGDIDSTAVTIRTKRGRLCQINTARRAAYGYDQRFEVLGSDGMLQAGNIKPTEVVAWSKTSVAQDVPEAFFLERYRAAYASEMAHFHEAVTQGKPVRTTVADGLKALELAEAAALSWREGRVVKVGA
ncbi:Inositol 2-dehydrogenase [Paraburkholderia tropica]|uniref:inositol 2-dehydrogenase n=1 Tax=Paraburkholderia TaxID=1822464 RepID=UPI001CAC7705|nr:MULTISPECIES: inositol 2-dehydrogenase [Paraburkholderia]CAG9219715.1 Inositol 2-dehydrogenase [Paraburkholderia tropica]